MTARETKLHFKALSMRRLELSGFADLADFVAFMRRPPDSETDLDRKDQALIGLLSQARHGADPKAGRLLLHLFWPSLTLLYGGCQSAGQDWDELFSEIMAAFHGAIADYPIEGRPARVAANVNFDAKKRFLAGRGKHGSALSLEEDLAADGRHEPEDAVIRAERDGFAGRFLAFVTRTDLISDEERRLIIDTHVHGRPLKTLARELGLNPDQARMRRNRAEARLREAAEKYF